MYKWIRKTTFNLLDLTENLETKCYLVTIDIKKENFGFGTNFIHWIKIFLNGERIVCNKWSWHNALFQTWKRCVTRWPNINLFAYIMSGNSFFFKRLLRIINILKVLIFLEIPSYIQLIQMTWFFFLKKIGFNERTVEYNFFNFTIFKFKTKLIKMRSCHDRTTGIGVCGIKCIDLTKDTIKLLILLFWYNKNIELQQNFKKIYNWYWKFFKDVATKKSCSRRWNHCFQNIGFIKIYIFSSSFTDT